MKIIVFDVNNASCNLVVCTNGYSMMIDCGSHSEKTCPIENIKQNKDWLGIKSIYNNGKEYPLTLLHITHPDDDHVRNSKVIVDKFTPFLLKKRKHEDFPDTENIPDDYKNHIDKKYRGKNNVKVQWGFSQNKIFQIPMDTIKTDYNLSKKIKNNSSILRYLEYGGIKVLFSGDLEKDGWDWLSKNDSDFINTMGNGIDILIAPHHGHKSGFPKSLFDLTGKIKIAILSKGSEAGIDGTDISTDYAKYTEGLYYKNINDDNIYLANGTLTTRSNGNIYFHIEENGNINIYTDKASSNHTKL